MNKVKGYINILITISVILVVLGLVFNASKGKSL